MIDNDTLKAIRADIRLIEPGADTRLKERKQRYREAQVAYNKEKRKKHKPIKKYYTPVIQSSDEHEPVDYDSL